MDCTSLAYNYAAYADVHVVTLYTESLPLLLFSDPAGIPKSTPRELCEKGDLGSMECNVLSGRALLATFELDNQKRCCAIFILMEKTMSSLTNLQQHELIEGSPRKRWGANPPPALLTSQ